MVARLPLQAAGRADERVPGEISGGTVVEVLRPVVHFLRTRFNRSLPRPVQSDKRRAAGPNNDNARYLNQRHQTALPGDRAEAIAQNIVEQED